MVPVSAREMARLVAHRFIVAPLLAGLIAALAGCSPPPTPQPPVQLRAITATSEGRLLAGLVEEYESKHASLRVDLSEGSAATAIAAVAAGQADLALIEREPDPDELLDPTTGQPILKAWPIGRDGLAVIVHPANPVQNLTRDQLRQVFSSQERRWDRLGGSDTAIQVVSREAGAPERLAFEQAILQGDRLARTAVIMPSDRTVTDFVAANPGAIGYLSMALVDSRVRSLALDGVFPSPEAVSQAGYPLSLPLIIVTRNTAPDKVRGFVEFALAPEGQAIVEQLCGCLR